MSSSPRNSIGNVRSDMDITYPEHLSRLHRHSVLSEYLKSQRTQKKTTRNRRGNRYRTQPVTFDEIQEVDEEATGEDNQISEKRDRTMSGGISSSELQLDFYKFSKQLGSMCKKFDKTDSLSDIEPSNDSNKTNGQQSLPRNLQQEQVNWMNKSREGSI